MFIAIASSSSSPSPSSSFLTQQTFLFNALSTIHKPKANFLTPSTISNVSCKYSQDELKDSGRGNENQFAKLAIVTLAAGVLTLGSIGDASAAKSGGRIGGQAFKSAAPRSSSPKVRNYSRTNIYVNPPVAPPLVGGYGYGYGAPFYGGWGWSPFSFFAPGPSVAVGFGGGFEVLVLFMFLGAAAAVVRKLTGSTDDDEDDY